jgi:RimJ/RimL family protein N-acetyltransferase
VIGTVLLRVEAEHRRAELGYLVAVEEWGNGYATEAAAAVVRFGFEALDLNRIYAFHFATNPASGNVLRKLGMHHEGRRLQHVLKWGAFLDDECYAILADQWRARGE